MRNILITGLAGLAMTAAVPAFAQETTADAPFSGLYVGGTIGYDAQPNDVGSSILFDRNLDGRFDNTVLTGTGANAFSTGFCNGAGRNQFSPANGGGCRNDKNGLSYSGRVGLDHQSGNIVYGVVGEFGTSNINDSVTAFSTTPANYIMYREIDWEASARGRLGYAADTTLFYGTFGAGYARIDRAFSSTQSVNTFTGRGDKNKFGFLGGGGIEQKLTPNVSFGLEYMYHQYQDDDYRVRVTGAAGTPFTNATNGGTVNGTDFRRSDDKFRWHSVRAVGTFRF